MKTPCHVRCAVIYSTCTSVLGWEFYEHSIVWTGRSCSFPITDLFGLHVHDLGNKTSRQGAFRSTRSNQKLPERDFPFEVLPDILLRRTRGVPVNHLLVSSSCLCQGQHSFVMTPRFLKSFKTFTNSTPLLSRSRGIRRKHNSTTSPHSHHEPVQLAYREFQPPDRNHNHSPPPILILHGLLGSKRNWTSISNRLSRDLQTDVYALDARNHGHSPHHHEHSLDAIEGDLRQFMDSHGMKKAVLIGHSSGSKAGMLFALRNPERTAGLIAVDGSPLGREPKDEVGRIEGYIYAIEEVVKRGCKSQAEADAVLSEFEGNSEVRQFLLTNLALHHNPPHYTVRPNLPVLLSYLQKALYKFPIAPGESPYAGPALFVVGKRSGFVPRDSYEEIRRGWFPEMEVAELGTGHWGAFLLSV